MHPASSCRFSVEQLYPALVTPRSASAFLAARASRASAGSVRIGGQPVVRRLRWEIGGDGRACGESRVSSLAGRPALPSCPRRCSWQPAVPSMRYSVARGALAIGRWRLQGVASGALVGVVAERMHPLAEQRPFAAGYHDCSRPRCGIRLGWQFGLGAPCFSRRGDGPDRRFGFLGSQTWGGAAAAVSWWASDPSRRAPSVASADASRWWSGGPSST